MKQYLRVQLLLAVSLLLMIPAVSFAQSKASGVQPAPYPTPISTGDKQHDQLEHAKAVKAWQESERVRNANLKGDFSSRPNPKVKSVEAASNSKQQTQVVNGQREITIIDLPGYPKMIDTGNPEMDQSVYLKAKAQWMNENPDLYKKYLDEHRIQRNNFKRSSVSR